MTCIAGLVHDGDVWVASDSEATWGWQKHDRGSKVFRKGDALMAWTGPCAVAEALKHRMSLPDVSEGKEDRWLAVDFPDAVRSCLSGCGLLKTSDGVSDTQGILLVAWRGRLASMCNRLGMYPAERGYLAHGSGGDVAAGVLYATEELEPEERLTRAIRASQVWSVGVGGNVYVERLRQEDSP